MGTTSAAFARLCARWPDEVQFIFITHNKTTMELASQLLGVCT
jgi:chromosome segregation ATPase